MLRSTSFNQDLGDWDVSGVTDLGNMLNGVTLNYSNYDSLLIGWDALELVDDLSFHAGSSQYCSGSSARANIISVDNWTITDGGYNESLCLEFGNLSVEYLTAFGSLNNQPQNETFVISVNVTCSGNMGSVCGEVNGSSRYNASSVEADTLIPVGGGSPFNVDNSSVSCGNLSAGDDCVVNFTINATGNIGNKYNIDVLFDGGYPNVDSVNSSDVLFRIVSPLFSLVLSDNLWDVGFGEVLNPGEDDNPALNNSDNGYNVTCQHGGAACNISIKANSHFASGINSIGIGNLTWNKLNNATNSSSFDFDFVDLNSSLPDGSTQLIYFWLDIPEEIVAGNYKSNFTIYGQSV
jgi:hypothetical protein